MDPAPRRGSAPGGSPVHPRVCSVPMWGDRYNTLASSMASIHLGTESTGSGLCPGLRSQGAVMAWRPGPRRVHIRCPHTFSLCSRRRGTRCEPGQRPPMGMNRRSCSALGTLRQEAAKDKAGERQEGASAAVLWAAATFCGCPGPTRQAGRWVAQFTPRAPLRPLLTLTVIPTSPPAASTPVGLGPRDSSSNSHKRFKAPLPPTRG